MLCYKTRLGPLLRRGLRWIQTGLQARPSLPFAKKIHVACTQKSAWFKLSLSCYPRDKAKRDKAKRRYRWTHFKWRAPVLPEALDELEALAVQWID